MRRAAVFSALFGLLLISIVSPVPPLRNLAKVRPGFPIRAVPSGRSHPLPAATPDLRKVGGPVHREAAPRDLATVSPASYRLTWWTVDGGGWTFSRGGAHTLGGTIGQPDAGLLRGGEYTLGGGFWGGGEIPTVAYRTYLPLVLRRS
jgi:hypothetical protein